MGDTQTMLDSMKISTRLIAEAALARGCEVKYFPGGKTKTGIMVITKDDKHYVVKSTVGAKTKGYGVFVATNKYMMSQLLNEFAIPTPRTMLFTDLEIAKDFLLKYGRVVVKPIDTNHGVGVTTNIATVDQLQKAIERAEKVVGNRTILLQEMCEGIDHRLLVVGDKVVAAAYREPAVVVGDGRRTIKELVAHENTNPLRGKGHSRPLTLLHAGRISQYLQKQGKSEEDIPSVGEQIVVADVANLSQGGRAIDVTDTVHPEIVAMALKAARIAGLSVCGVDVLGKDITKSPAESRSVIIELNESPGIRMHHFPSEGTPRNVAGAILDHVFEAGEVIV